MIYFFIYFFVNWVSTLYTLYLYKYKKGDFSKRVRDCSLNTKTILTDGLIIKYRIIIYGTETLISYV